MITIYDPEWCVIQLDEKRHVLSPRNRTIAAETKLPPAAPRIILNYGSPDHRRRRKAEIAALGSGVTVLFATPKTA